MRNKKDGTKQWERKVIKSVTLQPTLIKRFKRQADKRGLSFSGLLNLTLFNFLEKQKLEKKEGDAL